MRPKLPTRFARILKTWGMGSDADSVELHSTETGETMWQHPFENHADAEAGDSVEATSGDEGSKEGRIGRKKRREEEGPCSEREEELEGGHEGGAEGASVGRKRKCAASGQ